MHSKSHSAASRRSDNSRDICERCFLKIYVLKNVFPPWFTFHITSAVNGAFRVAKQNRLNWQRGSSCASVAVWSEKSHDLDPCQHPLQLPLLSQGSAFGKQTLEGKVFGFWILYFFLIHVQINHSASSLQVNAGVNLSGRLMLAPHNVSCDTGAERAVSNIFQNILLLCLKQLHCTHCNMSFKTPPLQMDIYPCRCELTDRCFGRFREAVSQFSVKVTVHHTNPH